MVDEVANGERGNCCASASAFESAAWASASLIRRLATVRERSLQTVVNVAVARRCSRRIVRPPIPIVALTRALPATGRSPDVAGRLAELQRVAAANTEREQRNEGGKRAIMPTTLRRWRENLQAFLIFQSFEQGQAGAKPPIWRASTALRYLSPMAFENKWLGDDKRIAA